MSRKKNKKEILAIIYDIWISGTKLGLKKKSCINSIEIKETVEGSDIATIKITDPEFLFIEDNIFIEDNNIKIRLGWDSSTYRINFEGYISALDIDFNTDGCPNLVLTCMDNTHIMNRIKKNNTFKNCTSAEVVRGIVQSYGFTCVIDNEYQFSVQESITQSDQTDIEFITNLADDEVYPFTARLVGNTFYYVKMGKLDTPKMTLTYRKYPHEVISFSPKINKETKQIEIKSATIDTGTKNVSTTSGSVASSNGSVSPNGKSSINNSTGSSSSSSGGYTYNPDTKKWTKN